MKTLHEFFIHELCILSSAAESMHNILKRMSSSATGKEIVELMDTYYFQSQYQLKKIREYQSWASSERNPVRSFVMRRLADEGQANLSYQGSWIIRDIVLLMTVNKMKHYQRTVIATALHHGDVLKAEEGIDLLNTIKKKIADEEKKALEIIQSLLTTGKNEELEAEIAHLLGLMVSTQIHEKEKLDTFLEVLENSANSDILQDALVTYQDKHKRVKEILKALQHHFPNAWSVPDWAVMKDIAKECNAVKDAAQETHLKDLGMICILQRIQHLHMAEYEVQKMLAEFLEEQEMKDQFHTLLENEKGNDQSFTAIGAGSLLKKGLDTRVQK